MIEPLRYPMTVERLLRHAQRDQQDLSAVERFAQRKASGDVPANESLYRELLPARDPAPGEQFAFEVDLDRCTACKACVTACHNLNGLEEGEAWRMTGVLVGERQGAPIQQTVTAACHHCVDPACSNGCPVNAYEKDPVTGIVRHLDDQCIGCKYCTLTCPYDVPRYSANLGIVRKCDMCSQRLKSGEAPACVQACPSKAIRISVVKTGEMTDRSTETRNRLLSGLPHPRMTQPTTAYVSKHAAPENLRPSDADRLRVEHTHLPLVIMLTLTQASVGAFSAMLPAGMVRPATGWSDPALLLALVAFGLGNVGLVAALFHLGRPQYAFRAILGMRTSWLSREIGAFSGFMAFAAGLCFWMAAPLLGLPLPHWVGSSGVGITLGILTALSGLGSVYTSVMVYHVTRRPCWDIRWTGSKFYLTTALLGAGMGLGIDAATGGASLTGWGGAVLALTLIKLALEWSQVRSRAESLRATARLLRGPLRRSLVIRCVVGLTGGVALPLGMLVVSSLAALAGPLAALYLLVGECLERRLFFRSMAAARMPGNATT